MVWEGDRLFCFLQQSKVETCGSPDKLSRVGELAGLITGRAKTGQLHRTPLDHTEDWNGQSRMVAVCERAHGRVCLERRVRTTVHRLSPSVPPLAAPPTPPPNHCVHTLSPSRPGHKDWLNVFSQTGQLREEVANRRLPLVGHIVSELTHRSDWTWTSGLVTAASF